MKVQPIVGTRVCLAWLPASTAPAVPSTVPTPSSVPSTVPASLLHIPATTAPRPPLSPTPATYPSIPAPSSPPSPPPAPVPSAST